MADIFTRRKRSAVMTAIRSHGNKDTELRLMQIFRANGVISLRTSLRLTGGLAARLEASRQTGLRFSPFERLRA